MAGNNDFLDSVLRDVELADAPEVRKKAKTENKLTESDELEEKAKERDEDLRDHFHVWFKRVFFYHVCYLHDNRLCFGVALDFA